LARLEPTGRSYLTEMLAELHRKLELADEVLIVNVGRYIGLSTARELAYARRESASVLSRSNLRVDPR
jgi:hypothetical protein